MKFHWVMVAVFWLTGVKSNERLVELAKEFEVIISVGFWKVQLECQHYLIEIEDDDYQAAEFKEKLIQLMPELHSWVQEGKKILIHCHAGVSRSPTALIFYLIWLKKEGSLLDYVIHLKKHRSCVAPNYGFLKMLKDFLQEIF